MPSTRNSSRSSTGSSSEASTVIEATTALGKRTSSLRSASSSQEENDAALSKRFKFGLSIAEERRNLRKLKNITNTVLTAEGAATVENRKRKKVVVGEEGGGKRKKDGEESAEAIVAESQQKLRESLGKHYFDVARRLNLEYEPGCLRNVKQCAERHANRMVQARRVDLGRQRDTKELLIEARPLQFLEHLELALMRNQFIDSQLFTKTLEVILTINPPSSELNADYKISSVLEHATSVLDRTVEQFPPCWLDLRASYQGIIFGSLEEDCFSRYDRSEGLLKVVLFLLETCVESDPAAGRLHKTASSNMTSMMATFHQWEMENNQKYDFDLLSRDERFERLFIVLSILVKILELDLSMWILRHPHKTKENMQKDTRKPLLVSVLWNEHSTVGEVNSFVRRIVTLYVNVVALRFPKEDVRVVARLLSVIGTTINLSEIQYDGTVDYPCIKDNTRYFVRQISRQVESSPYYSMSLCLRAIEQMRSPLIRMILVDDLLHRFNHQLDSSAGPCAASYLKHLVKGRWRSCAVDDGALQQPSDLPPERYPFLDRRRTRKSAHEIGRTQYVNLLLTGFRAYMQVFPVTHYFASFKQQPPASTSYATRSPSKSPKRLSTEQLRGHRFDFRALERRINVLEVQRKRSRTIVRPAAERPVPVDAAPLVLEEVNVTPALLVYYRDELKHLLLVQRWLRTRTAAEQEERDMFAGWRKYLASIDETLSCE
ncbi:uncharacterized protein LOC120430048 [Culex pipiens pallens]|uniref:uncharacterized protein LOC120430048 n=1 Tax=Culex pipiens pallens TaxID=42434 RepID=UPI00195465AA|nr:uncharacterized protein LOC120430048 [Culex pipiens pallens]